MPILVYLANLQMGGGGSQTVTSAPHLTWGTYSRLSEYFRGRIPKRVCEIIDEIVKPEIADIAPQPHRKLYELHMRRKEEAMRAQLKVHGIAYRKLYTEAMRGAMRQRDEEVSIVLLLCQF